MIQIKTAKNKGFELSDRSQTVLLDGEKIGLGQESITETGEFEIAGIEVIYGENAAMLIWEQMQMVYVFKFDPTTAFEKEQFSSADVVIFGDTDAELNKVFYSDLVNAYDPSVVIFHKETKIEKAFRDSLKVTETAIGKISEQTLPAEGRDLIIVG